MPEKAPLQTKTATPKSATTPSRLGLVQCSRACGGARLGEIKSPTASLLERGGTNSPAFPSPLKDQLTDQIQQSTLSGYSFGNLAIESKERLGIQTKLTIGQPNDQYEQEADRVADQVMRMPDPTLTTTPLANSGSPLSIQRLPGTGLQQQVIDQEEEEESKTLQRKEQTGQPPATTPALEAQLQASQGGGQPLPIETRSFMESRFGHDFSQVRVHADANAAQMNRSLQAHAFTHKQDVFFAAGKYNPDSSAGKRLLAHELTHTIQQGGASVSNPAVMKASDLSGVDIIQRDDAAFESGSGVDTAITSGTMTADPIMGTTVTASNCRGLFGCNVGFLFSKAYKGTYPYRAAGRDVKGVYVKIESVYDHNLCGTCDQIKLIQVVRNTTRGSSGNIETADPGNAARRERSGWGDPNAPSRGWRVDRITSATVPFYGVAGFTSEEGSPSSPAILWDAPGDWDTDTNAGKEFQTFLVCETASGRKTIAGVTWGYYIDASGNINFRPATPIATCGATQELQDSVTRWEGIAGNQPTNIDFAAESAVDHEGERSILWFDRDSINLRNDSTINSDTHYNIAIRRIRQHILATMPYTRIIIHGYSSTDGDPGYNRRLSERRAIAIRDRLISEGIPAHMLAIEAHGEDSEFSPADLNRRVEIETTHFVGPLLPGQQPGP